MHEPDTDGQVKNSINYGSSNASSMEQYEMLEHYEMQVKYSFLMSTQATESKGLTPNMPLVIKNQNFQDNQSSSLSGHCTILNKPFKKSNH